MMACKDLLVFCVLKQTDRAARSKQYFIVPFNLKAGIANGIEYRCHFIYL